MEWNLHETTSQWKTYGKRLFSEDLEVQDDGSNPNSMFVIISELKFFLLTGVLTKIFNTMDLVKFIEKNKKLSFRL
jgi:hypothetical protein